MYVFIAITLLFILPEQFSSTLIFNSYLLKFQGVSIMKVKIAFLITNTQDVCYGSRQHLDYFHLKTIVFLMENYSALYGMMNDKKN